MCVLHTECKNRTAAPPVKLKQLQSSLDSFALDWNQVMPADEVLAPPRGSLGLEASVLSGLRDARSSHVLENHCRQALKAIEPQLQAQHIGPEALETICAGAVRHCMLHKGKGLPDAFYLSKDGSTLAVLHEHQQITELNINDLLTAEPTAKVPQAKQQPLACVASPAVPQDIFQGDSTPLYSWQTLESAACPALPNGDPQSDAVQIFAVHNPSAELAPAVPLADANAQPHMAPADPAPPADVALSRPVHDPALDVVSPVPLPDVPAPGTAARPLVTQSVEPAKWIQPPKAASKHQPLVSQLAADPPMTATDWQELAKTLHAQGEQMSRAVAWAQQRGLSKAAKAYQNEVHALYLREQDASRRALNLRAKSQASALPPDLSSPFAPGWGTGDAAAGLRSVPWRSYCGQESYKVSVRAFGPAVDYDPVKNQVLFAGVQLGGASVRAAAGHSCGFMSDEMAPMVKFTASIGARMGGEATLAIGFNGIKGTISAVGRQRLGPEKSPSIEPKGKDILGLHPKVKGIWGLSFSAAAGVGYMHTTDPHPLNDGRSLKQ